MTKMKSKKMTKSTFAIIIMAVAMVAMLAFGGTYAYFTATATTKATEGITTGTVSVKGNTITTVTTENVVTNDVVASGVKFTNESNVPTWVIISFDVKLNNVSVPTTGDDRAITYTLADGWGEAIVKGDVTYYAKKADAVAVATPVDVCGAITFVASDNCVEGNVTGTTYMNKPLVISISSWAIQQNAAENGPDAVAALLADLA